jgi:hypothetical protein
MGAGLQRAKAAAKATRVRPWQKIATAPKDGTEIEVRGYNWGDRTRGRHRMIAYWNGGEWRDAHDENSSLHYLDEWRPYDGQKHAL